MDARHCTCGVSVDLATLHPAVREAAAKAWDVFHRGIGHQRTDGEGATRARHRDLAIALRALPPRPVADPAGV
jgi:hypothetical protein